MSNVSIKDVARLAGVSIATVSRCLNFPEKVGTETRARVNAAIGRTGYRPNALARNLRRGRSNIISVVMPRVGTVFVAGVLRGIRRAASASGYSVLIDDEDSSTSSMSQILALAADRQTDGVILLANLMTDSADIARAHGPAAPPVVVGCKAVSRGLAKFPSVQIDNVAAAKDATNFLIDQGHRNIGVICGLMSSPVSQHRVAGYCEAMQTAGLDVEGSWIVEGSLTIEGARKATRQLLSDKMRPTAIFCLNDEMAIACMYEIKATGLKVPNDISVIGFDDMPLARISDPPLTTIDQPARKIGEQMMRQLIDQIENGRSGASVQTLAHKLIIRDSVASPRSN